MKKFTDLQKDELIGLLDVRYDTIINDVESADDFETEESLSTLRSKLEAGSTNYTINECKWMIQELENRKSVAYGNDLTIGQKYGFINSMDKAIDMLLRLHNIDHSELMNKINNFENIY